MQVWRAVAVALNRMLYNDIATEAAFSPQVGHVANASAANRLRTPASQQVAAHRLGDGVGSIEMTGSPSLLLLLEPLTLDASTSHRTLAHGPMQVCEQLTLQARRSSW